MNRVIKFRGKRIDNGEWVYGYIDATMYKDVVVVHTDTGTFEVVPETVGQFTGVVDKNGKEIYEGDVVDCWSQGSHCKNGIVTWIENRIFISIKSKYGTSDVWHIMPNNNGIDEGLSIIGNVFDNSELLKGGDND